MPRGSSLISWQAWLAALLTVALAVFLSLLGSELARLNAVHRLDTLRSAHWTERARVFTQTNHALRLFRLYLLTLTTVLVLFGMPGLGSQPLLRFSAVVGLMALGVGDPLARRWVGRATAGSSTGPSWLETKRFGLMMFPAFWILIAFGLLAPQSYDAWGWAWASALLITLIIAQAGGAALLCRAWGIIGPPTDTLRQAVQSVAQAAGVRQPTVYELKTAHANAMALPTLGWILFTSGAVAHLEPRALSAIAAHELGHLRESRLIKVVRIASGAALFLSIALVPAFPEEPLIGLACGCGLFAFVALGMRAISVRLEHRADAMAHQHEHEEGDYAAALERIYQLNWMAAGVVNRTHPSLYDRMERAGVRPSYPRPKPAPRGPVLLALGFGAVGGLGLAFVVNPLLVTLLESLSQAG